MERYPSSTEELLAQGKLLAHCAARAVQQSQERIARTKQLVDAEMDVTQLLHGSRYAAAIGR